MLPLDPLLRTERPSFSENLSTEETDLQQSLTDLLLLSYPLLFLYFLRPNNTWLSIESNLVFYVPSFYSRFMVIFLISLSSSEEDENASTDLSTSSSSDSTSLSKHDSSSSSRINSPGARLKVLRSPIDYRLIELSPSMLNYDDAPAF